MHGAAWLDLDCRNSIVDREPNPSKSRKHTPAGPALANFLFTFYLLQGGSRVFFTEFFLPDPKEGEERSLLVTIFITGDNNQHAELGFY